MSGLQETDRGTPSGTEKRRRKGRDSKRGVRGHSVDTQT